jgi:flagellar motor switch protein FliM
VRVGTGLRRADGDGRRARRYDFRVPDKFPKDVLRQVVHVYDAMSRTLTTSLSAMLRTTVRVEDAAAEQSTYDAFVREASDPAILAGFTAEPLQGSALLEVDPVIAFPMIDRMLGGSGDGMGLDRPVTEIELSVVRRVLGLILDNWREAWAHVLPLRPRLQGVETNPLFIQLAAPAEIVLIVTMTCGLGRQEGRLRFCFPFATIEPIVQRLASRQWAAAAGEPPGSREAELRRSLGAVDVPVAVEIAAARLPLSQILGFREGDVLRLGVPLDAPACVRVRGRPGFLGRVGRRGRRLAVRIDALGEEGRP